MAIVEPIRNEDTQERRQSQTVIVPDTQETDDQLKIQLKIYNELGTESLKFRRWFRQLCVFYKIKTTQIPKYLHELLPTKSYTYNTRNKENVETYYCRTDLFKESFSFPM